MLYQINLFKKGKLAKKIYLIKIKCIMSLFMVHDSIKKEINHTFEYYFKTIFLNDLKFTPVVNKEFYLKYLASTKK